MLNIFIKFFHEMMETLSGKGSLTVRDVQNLIALVTSENEKSNGEIRTGNCDPLW